MKDVKKRYNTCFYSSKIIVKKFYVLDNKVVQPHLLKSNSFSCPVSYYCLLVIF